MSDPYRRDAASAGQAGDPLAELARLIGQNDPFADLGRPQRPAAGATRPAPAEADWHSDSADSSQYAQPDAYQQSYGQPDAGYPAAHDPAAHDPATHEDAGYQQPYYGQVQDGPAHHQQAAEPYQHAHDQHAQAAYSEPHALHADEQQAEYGQAVPGYEQTYEQHDYAYRPQHDYAEEPHAHAGAYDERAPARRRGGLVAVMGVVALAVLGTAGAYGYRAMFGTGGSSPSTAPVIKAVETPNKIQVASAPDSTKLIQDRLPDRPQSERVVPREEQPVDVRTGATSSSPNIAFPRLAPPNTAPASANPSAPPVLPQVAASAGPGISAEPKKIRTVQIRPDADGTPRTQPTPPSRSVAPAAPAPSASQDSPFPTARAAARPEPSANGPLSLSPTNNPASAPAPRNRIQTASATPTDRAAPGSYVQISSRKSESEAQNALRLLQGKYPSVLGGKAAVIRRADLGDKGVFYRAMVGPFASTDQASQLCSSLKAAGGDCVVQRN